MKTTCQFCDLKLKPCNLKNHLSSFHKEEFYKLYPDEERTDGEEEDPLFRVDKV
eukprot:CAMPEP_0170510548 /NCGR_PEP_ID=MMETSP0208-20121228/65827_1 /TAXON_ID=197538 /ORGANISM="Strombidium inclinatum, Strain S3" /LENGTH=53 /DNA_ID=CAMNT_0010794019 /DNA_START=1420 /DNA_END=1581 /DNA_ORIENTATION=+